MSTVGLWMNATNDDKYYDYYYYCQQHIRLIRCTNPCAYDEQCHKEGYNRPIEQHGTVTNPSIDGPMASYLTYDGNNNWDKQYPEH